MFFISFFADLFYVNMIKIFSDTFVLMSIPSLFIGILKVIKSLSINKCTKAAIKVLQKNLCRIL